MKTSRWYEKNVDGTYSIYDAPYVSESLSVSLVKDLAYYRSHFRLSQIEGQECPRFYGQV